MKLLLSFFLIIAVSVQGQTPDKRPAFKKKNILVGNQRLRVEIADTDEKRAHGLMFLKQMPENDGMLFVFDRTEMQSFWMKNTYIPLSIGYFDAAGKLIEVLDMEPESILAKNLPSYPSSSPAKYALEMNKGWFKKYKIKKRTRLKIF